MNVGERYGARVVLAWEGTSDGTHHARVRWLCDCGRIGVSGAETVRRTERCRPCAMVVRSARRRANEARGAEPDTGVGALLREARDRAPEVWLGDEPACLEAVASLAELLGPVRLEDVGELMALSRERVRQVEVVALRRMKARLRLVGVREPAMIEPRDWMEGA